jgi:serine/threonine protein kinase
LEDLTGREIGRYQIVAPLAAGSMATVYKAFQPVIHRYVALKVLPKHLASEPTYVGRFQQEARIVANLQHPNILSLFDYGEADGYTYMVMPLVEGGTLAGLLQGQPLPLERIRFVVSQMADALHYAHQQGVIHRDVKPSNVLINKHGTCLLTDFGIAKMIEVAVRFTGTGESVGTPTYMSPEQGLAQPVDRRSDIYSLGVILYQMATGQLPFKGKTPIATVLMHVNDPLPPPWRINPDLSPDLDRVIVTALAKQPADRYATAAELAKDLLAATAARG